MRLINNDPPIVNVRSFLSMGKEGERPNNYYTRPDLGKKLRINEGGGAVFL